MALLFWIVAIICFSSITAKKCVSDCPHTKQKYQDGTLNIDAMQKTTCNCTRFQKDHITSGENKKHCLDFRFKIVWVDTPSFNDSNWGHCIPTAKRLSISNEELRDYDWVGLMAKTYANDLKDEDGLERAGPKEYVLLVVLSVLLAIAVGAIFQQQKRKNMIIHDLEAKNNELSHMIELYTRNQDSK